MSACNLLSSSHDQLTDIGIRIVTRPVESITEVQFAASNWTIPSASLTTEQVSPRSHSKAGFSPYELLSATRELVTRSTSSPGAIRTCKFLKTPSGEMIPPSSDASIALVCILYVMSRFEILTRPEVAALIAIGMRTSPSPFCGMRALNAWTSVG